MRTLENLQMDGGCLAFNFINTVNTRKPAPEFEYLKTFGDLLTWSEKAGSLDGMRLQALREHVAEKPEDASIALNDAIDAREMLYGLFSAIAAGNPPDAAVTNAFNRRLSESFQSIHVKFGPASAEIHLNGEDVALNEPFIHVMKSAIDVLTREDIRRIKECPRCGWLFLDTSKNGKRKWCDMNVCGSREKSLEYYYRKTRRNV
ncbi:CGNR zinc finger domain-containing protein [Dyadobacter fermentans]|uniref:CGNR zinc finger domain-containing protein n=1 Tax=Dyadobacter fermentans TaxID=94254 RepID=UPI001CBABB0B|nr:CGNR zinc finger domain-containing protein [Dyadobacter fermentans]MBZ1362445.1 CGNR zinc finger domain-containing protein [Dyadobacter fermentans]